jgi:hypothetical protein
MTCPKCRDSGGLGPCPDCGAEPLTDPLAAWLQCTDAEIVRSLIDDWKADAAKLSDKYKYACRELSSVTGALQSVRAERDEAQADKESLLTEVGNLREAFQGAWETTEYWKKQAENHRAERDKQFANVAKWQDSLGYLSPRIAAADFRRYKAVLLDLWETVGDTKPWQTWFANRGIDPEELK